MVAAFVIILRTPFSISIGIWLCPLSIIEKVDCFNPSLSAINDFFKPLALMSFSNFVITLFMPTKMKNNFGI